MDFIVEFFD